MPPSILIEVLQPELEVDIIHKTYIPTSIRLVKIVSQEIYIYKDTTLWMCDCSICILQRRKLGCVHIFCKICLFQRAKFCILDAKFEIFFNEKKNKKKKTRGQLKAQRLKSCTDSETKKQQRQVTSSDELKAWFKIIIIILL